MKNASNCLYYCTIHSMSKNYKNVIWQEKQKGCKGLDGFSMQSPNKSMGAETLRCCEINELYIYLTALPLRKVYKKYLTK